MSGATSAPASKPIWRLRQQVSVSGQGTTQEIKARQAVIIWSTHVHLTQLILRYSDQGDVLARASTGELKRALEQSEPITVPTNRATEDG